MPAPTLAKKIPNQVINEQAAFGPFDLKQFIQSQEGAISFQAELKGGQALPQGMICTSDGILTGIPAKGTEGNYEIKITAMNESGNFETSFLFTIKPSVLTTSAAYMDKLKAQIWEALGQNLPIPDLSEMYERPITALEIYYLLERWGIITMWDAFNLEPAGEKAPLNLEGVSPHYQVYDRGSCLVAAPIDLFSHERTILDGMQTAQAMAREVYRRQWTVEMAGFDKMVRAAWMEFQHLADLYGKPLEVINFSPSAEDLKLYQTQKRRLYGG